MKKSFAFTLILVLVLVGTAMAQYSVADVMNKIWAHNGINITKGESTGKTDLEVLGHNHALKQLQKPARYKDILIMRIRLMLWWPAPTMIQPEQESEQLQFMDWMMIGLNNQKSSLWLVVQLLGQQQNF